MSNINGPDGVKLEMTKTKITTILAYAAIVVVCAVMTAIAFLFALTEPIV